MDKKISDTIKRSLILTIGGLKTHMLMGKVKDKIKTMTGDQTKYLDFRKDREKYLLSIGFLYCLVDQGINFSKREQEEYSRILENLVKQFNKEINRDKKLKKFYDKNKKLISEIKALEAEKLIYDGTINEGMIPKIRTCINAVNNGVRGVVVIDGRKPHSILFELFSDKGSGTLIRK